MQECANFGRQTKGLQSEDVALDYFLNLNFRLLEKRARIVGVEVDLLFQKSNVIHIVEVKTFREGFPLLSKSQFNRLKRVANYLHSRHRSSVRLHLASVERGKGLHVHWDIGDEVQLY